MRLVVTKGAVLSGFLITCTLVGCTSEDGPSITVDGVREAAVDAGTSPDSCPIPYDVAAALPDSPQVRPGEVAVEVSKTTTPAPDPLAAQQDQGMSAIDAAAGVSIDCAYEVGGRTVRVWLFATPGGGSINVMAPTIVGDSGVELDQLRDFLADAPGPGEVGLVPGGEVAVARLPVEGDGDATLLVTPDGIVTGDELSTTTTTLLGQVEV